MNARGRIVRAAMLSATFALACACSRSGSAPAAPSGQSSQGSASTPIEQAPATAATAAPAPPPPPAAPGLAETPPPATRAPGLRGGGTDNNQPVMQSGTANPFDEHGGVAAAAGAAGECARDEDCVCGIDRSTGACAIGPAGRVDTGRQCPDFCAGVGGQMRVVCERGRCAQR